MINYKKSQRWIINHHQVSLFCKFWINGVLSTVWNSLLVKPTDYHKNMFVYLICADNANKESVFAIQRSIFTLCLDGAMPRVSEETYHSCAAIQMLHGGGSQWNSGNRWFDKTLQVRIIINTHFSQHVYRKSRVWSVKIILKMFLTCIDQYKLLQCTAIKKPGKGLKLLDRQLHFLNLLFSFSRRSAESIRFGWMWRIDRHS